MLSANRGGTMGGKNCFGVGRKATHSLRTTLLRAGKQDWAGRHFQSFSPFLALQEPLHRRIQTMHREGGRQAEHLFQTLLHRAFSETDSPTAKVEAVEAVLSKSA
jgi:hypothetical protein